MQIGTWIANFRTRYKNLDYFVDSLGEFYSDISFFEYKTSQFIEHQPDDEWVVELYFKDMPDFDRVASHINDIAKNHGIKEIPIIETGNLSDRDWIAEIKANSKPFTIDNFRIYNSHHEIEQDNLIPLIIDPTRAFGSGEHYTTRSCLKALCYLFNNGYKAEKMLDVGCGSGILAIAMSKLWHRKIIATDIDEQSVIISKENASINSANDMVDVYLSDGYHNSNISNNSPYDLITCNILAQPLINMAEDLVAHLKQGGVAILSGFLINQEERVVEAHTMVGLSVIHRITDDAWCTIIMKKD